ncbi:hypothetical protein [Streptomyces sp. NRRL S-241]|uniref:hypothetical protein n=1 Tax=Streptomyces sp. NRRL S-241 TaxID=1463896 RepID=UPI0004C226F5|nr:hypothetical protein [Streptomyces sp. NRRL S-241]
MQDLNTDKVILRKVVRRKRFVLGGSVALAATSVAQMDDGSVRVITERRPGHFLPKSPCIVTYVSRINQGGDQFQEAAERIREFERQYITEELPEISA